MYKPLTSKSNQEVEVDHTRVEGLEVYLFLHLFLREVKKYL